MIAVVETGVANLASIANAFARLGERVTLTSDPAVVRKAARLVLPGVGAFGAAAAQLRARGLDGALRESVAGGADAGGAEPSCLPMCPHRSRTMICLFVKWSGFLSGCARVQTMGLGRSRFIN